VSAPSAGFGLFYFNNLMKAIETHYSGYRFRSRLEARWAVFFEAAEIQYLYELEGFESNNGERYLPDFYLPETSLRGGEVGVFIEIKYNGYQGLSIPGWFNKQICLFEGNPIHIWDNYESNGGEQFWPWWDNNMRFWKCNNCRSTKIEFHEGNYDYCYSCKNGRNDYKDLHLASIEATSARFEHGETP